MCVGVQFRTEEKLHKGISIADTHGVDEDVTWAEHQSLENNCDGGESLPHHGETWIVLRLKSSPAAWQPHKSQSDWTDLQPKPVLYVVEDLHRFFVRSGVYHNTELV